MSLAVNDTYATAALVLGDSLRDTNTSRKLAILISNNVSQLLRYVSITHVDNMSASIRSVP